MWSWVQRKEKDRSSKWHNALHRNLSSISTSTLYHQLPTLRCSEAPPWRCCLVSCMHTHRHKWIELWTRNDRPHPSQQANSSCIVQTKSLHAIAMFLLRLIVDSTGLSKQVWQATGYLTFHFVRGLVFCLTWPVSMTCFTPWCSEYISTTMTAFVHTDLLFWLICLHRAATHMVSYTDHKTLIGCAFTTIHFEFRKAAGKSWKVRLA